MKLKLKRRIQCFTPTWRVSDYKARTVREFIDEVLNERPAEHGYFEVRNSHNKRIGHYVEYGRSALNDDLDAHLPDLDIVKVECTGGWGRYDYIIQTKE